MPHDVQTRTYSRHASVVFRITKERFGGLSNMASGFPLEVSGVRVWSSEALYQACRFPHLPDVQKLIISERSPMTAKMRSKPHRKDSRPDWEKINVTVMKWCLRVKLAQNWTTFGDLLLSTGEAPIVEESTRDKFWAAEPLDDGTLVGGNVLGRLLMELREEFRGPNKQLLTRVVAPNIANFLFLGKPIGTIEADRNAEAKDSVEDATSVTDPGTFQLAESPNPVDQGEFQPRIEQPTSEDRPKEVKSTWNQIPRECKRLAEVDFPVAEVSKHSAREKSIRQGYPSTLQLWWARRPMGACRAMLLGIILPDPCDPYCPEAFNQQARRLLPGVQGDVGPTHEDLRRALLKFIGDFANWDLSTSPNYLEIARSLVRAAHGHERPLVVDPFSGGGSIPLEALRIGCEVFASDLNPVACLILKITLEDIPRFGPSLMGEMEKVTSQIRDEVEKRLNFVYPPDPDGTRPIAYFWAKTVRCESPKCGAEIPLLSSFWLSKKSGAKRALRYQVVRPRQGPPQVEFVNIFAPANDEEVAAGTARQGKAICPCCGSVLAPKRLQALMMAQQGGGDVQLDALGHRTGGARLVAVAYSDSLGRQYRLPADRDYEIIWKAQQEIFSIKDKLLSEGQSLIPHEPVNPVRPSPNARGLSAVTRYGVRTFGDLFNARQKLSLIAFVEALRKLWDQNDETERRLAEIMAAALGKRADYSSIGTRWHLTFEKATCTFSKQALSNTWDYVEPTAVGETSGSFGAGLDTVLRAVKTIQAAGTEVGQTDQADASASFLPDRSAHVWFTDPPYYDAIPYADLSDFFFVWLKRALPGHPLLYKLNDPETGLTPKLEECVWNQTYFVDGKRKDGAFFRQCISKAFKEGRRILKDDGVGCVVFAHKTTEGWEALLSGMVEGGWVITGSWPIATERRGRLQSQDSAALATSVHLLCRPRANGGVGGWEDILRELPGRIGDWMERLSTEGIRGADLVFSCIGPALELFSKYDKVETAEGREVKLDEFLEKVWEVVGRSALQQVLGTAEARARNSAAGALEEDARLTALFLWTLQGTDANGKQKAENGKEIEADDEEEDETEEGLAGKPKKGFVLIYDVVRRFAQPLGIHLENWDGRIIETKKGVVRLLSVLERAEQLFGEGGAQAVARALERTGGRDPQFMLFPEPERGSASPVRGPRARKQKKAGEEAEALASRREATTLDRVHAAMLLQARGEATALRALLQAEIERSPDFLRLANALSALYPKDSEEKRLLDAMLLAVPR